MSTEQWGIGASVVLAIGLSAGCAGTLDDPGRFVDASAPSSVASSPGAIEDAAAPDQASSCGDVTETILAAKCTSAGCHDSKTAASNLDLASPDVAGRLLGKPATGGTGILIDPGGAPDKSVLYLKVTSSPPFGSQMPIGGTLSATEIACLGAWITAAADAGAAVETVDAGASTAEDAGAPSTNDAGTSSANDAGGP